MDPSWQLSSHLSLHVNKLVAQSKFPSTCSRWMSAEIWDLRAHQWGFGGSGNRLPYMTTYVSALSTPPPMSSTRPKVAYSIHIQTMARALYHVLVDPYKFAVCHTIAATELYRFYCSPRPRRRLGHLIHPSMSFHLVSCDSVKEITRAFGST